MSDPRFMPERDDIGGLMAKLSEELGEAQAALGKTMRWGCFSVNPDLSPDQQETNFDWLVRELRDVQKSGDALLAALNNLELDPSTSVEAHEPRFQDRRRAG